MKIFIQMYEDTENLFGARIVNGGIRSLIRLTDIVMLAMVTILNIGKSEYTELTRAIGSVLMVKGGEVGMKDSLKKLGDDYGLTPEGVRHAIEAYKEIICEITGGKLSKLTYDADYILEETEEHYRWKYRVEARWNYLYEDSDGFVHGLPGDDGQYLMTDGKDIWIDDYVDGVDDGIWLDSGRDIREVKAWMEMPESLDT